MRSAKSKSTSHVPNVALTKLVKEVTAVLDKAEQHLGPDKPVMTAAERRRTGKPRKGADKVIGTLGALIKQYELDSPALHSDEMLALLSDVQTLTPLMKRVEKLLSRVSDEVFGAHGQSWEMALQFYALLQRRANGNGDLQKNLEPIAAFFSYRHPSKKEGKPTKRQVQAEAKLRRVEKVVARQRGKAQGGAAATSPARAPSLTLSATATTAPAAVASGASTQAPASTTNGASSASPSSVRSGHG